MAEDEAAASEASEWESREREVEHLAALREEDRLGDGLGGFLFSFHLYFSLPFSGTLAIAGGRLQLDGSGFTHP